MSIKFLNNHVAVKPVKEDAVKIEETKKFIVNERVQNKLVKTEVLFDSVTFKSGEVVYVRSEQIFSPAVSNKLKVGDLDVILVQESQIMAKEE